LRKSTEETAANSFFIGRSGAVITNAWPNTRVCATRDALNRGCETGRACNDCRQGGAVIKNYRARFDGQIAELTHHAAPAPA
jgi:hypothetical protein